MSLVIIDKNGIKRHLVKIFSYKYIHENSKTILPRKIPNIWYQTLKTYLHFYKCIRGY